MMSGSISIVTHVHYNKLQMEMVLKDTNLITTSMKSIKA